jgi:hypothetical protein
MSLPNSGYIQLGTDGSTGRSINSEFGYGNDMQSYLGVYAGKNGVAYRFPSSGNQIAANDFYGTSRISGGATYLGTGYWTVPVYNTIYATIQGGNGGQGGNYGFNACNSTASTQDWTGGNAGNASYFGGYLGAGGGNGGNNSGGGAGSGATANGGWTNPFLGGSGPASGSQIYITIGNGGNGGHGGVNYPFLVYGCFPLGDAGPGAAGNAGYVYVSWS